MRQMGQLKIVIFFLVPLFLIIAAALILPRYYYPVSDWIKLQGYTAPAEIAALADEAAFTTEARNTFYVHKPEINEKTEFNENCPFAERTFVLGCYTGSNIYLLDIEDKQLEGVETVTAAHEMLHAAYSRLSISERNRIDDLLEAAFEKQDDQRLVELIEDYREQDPTSIPTELHSILATEVADLGDELEDYYSQYFTDRSVVVDAYNGYEKVFSDLEQQIERLQDEITSLSNRVSELESEITAKRGEINDINDELEQLRSSGDVSGYNARVPEQNQLVNSYNSAVEDYNSSIQSHNKKVEQINEIVVQQNNLVHSIDSKFEEL